MSHRHQVAALSKFLVYILAHRPDEFGLVLDEHRFVAIKELLQAINEEPGWSHVRQADVIEAAMTKEREHLEIRNNRIRAVRGHSDESRGAPIVPPKTLFYGARRKVYPHIVRHGLTPVGKRYVHLTVTSSLAMRIAKRRDPNPVMLEVHAERAAHKGIVFYQASPLIFLTDRVPTMYITGPPLSSVLPEKTGPHVQPAAPSSHGFPDSVPPDLAMKPVHQRKRGTTWKEPSRKLRRRQRYP